MFLSIFFSVQLNSLRADTIAERNWAYRGDLNEDVKLDIFDLLDLLKVLSGQSESERKLKIADIYPDDKVDIFDLLGILKILSGNNQPGKVFWGPVCWISGIIEYEGKGIDNIYVRLRGNGIDTTMATMSNGRYDAINIPYGTYTLIPFSPHFEFHPDSVTLNLNGDIKIEPIAATLKVMQFVSLTGGTFQMGSETEGYFEKPVHSVSLNPFSIGKSVVSQR